MTLQHSPAQAVLVAGHDAEARAVQAARVALEHAYAVDRDARFPVEAVDALRRQRLLGAGIPIELGGEGASISTLAETAYGLGRACASTAMIYAMHQTKVACLVRHGGGSARIGEVLRRIATDQLLMASSTTEGTGGGNVRSSSAAIEQADGRVSLERDATVISYGAEADGIVTVARRSGDAASSDQVLCVFLKEDYTLDRLNGWDTLGMRGTCSSGFRLRASAPADQVLAANYAEIHGRTMTPVSHVLWSSAWAGIAAAAVEKAQAFTRTAARGAGGQLPPGARHHAEAVSSLTRMRALIVAALDRLEGAADPTALDALDARTEFTMLKVEASELAVAAVGSALRATGLAGYRQDGPFSIGRHLRDVLSSPIMIHNDRIVANLATAALMTPVPTSLRARSTTTEMRKPR